MFESMDLNSLLPRSAQDNPSNINRSISTSNSSSTDNDYNNNNNDNDDAGLCMSLTWQERLIGCGACMILGYLLSFGAFFRFKDLMMGNPIPFVVHTTVGNIIALTGSCFLRGPHRQWHAMMQDTRKVATMAYIGSLVLTLIVAFVPPFFGQALMLLILLVIQYAAIAWYCLSYIPYAREAIQAFVTRMLQRVDG